MSGDTRTRILIEAEHLFGQHGFAATRLAHIAAAVGLGNAGLLHHFPSKAALYRAVLEEIAADLDKRYVVEESTDSSGSEVAQLEQLIYALLALNRDRPNAIAIIAHEFLDQSGRIDGAEVLPLAGVVRDTAALLRAGQEAGTIRAGDPVVMTAALHGVIIIGCLGRTVYQRTGGALPTIDWESELVPCALATVVSGSQK